MKNIPSGYVALGDNKRSLSGSDEVGLNHEFHEQQELCIIEQIKIKIYGGQLTYGFFFWRARGLRNDRGLRRRPHQRRLEAKMSGNAIGNSDVCNGAIETSIGSSEIDPLAQTFSL